MDLETLRLKYEVTGLDTAKRGIEDLSRRAAIGLGKVADAFRKGDRNAAAFAGTAVPALDRVVKSTERLDTALTGLSERLGRLDGRRVTISFDLRPDAAVLAGQLRELDALARRRHTVKLDVTGANELRLAAAAVGRLSGALVKLEGAPRHANVDIDVANLDDAELASRVLPKLANALTRLQATRTRIKVDVRVAGLTSRLKDAAAAISTLSRALVKLQALPQPVRVRIHVDEVTGDIAAVLALGAALRHLRSRNVTVTANTAEPTAALNRLRGALGGALSGLRSLAGAGVALAGLTGRVTAVTSALATAAAGALGLGEALTGVAGGAAVGALAGVSAAALGLGSAFAVAGGGLAAFALFAAPAISAVTTGVQAYEKAQQAAAKALAEHDVRAYNKALADQHAALAALTPSQRATVAGFEQLKGAWLGYSHALEPSILATVNRGFALARTLLPQLVPVAGAVSKALGGVLTTAQGFLTGGVFRGLLADVTREAGPLITQFAGVGMHLVGAFTNPLHAGLPLISTVMGQLGGLASGIESAFASAGFTKFVAFGVQVLPQLAGLLGDAAHAVGDLAAGLAPLAPVALGVIDGLVKGLDKAFTGPGMSGFVATVQQLLPVVGQALGQVASAVGSLMGTLQPLAPVVIGTLGKLAGVLATVFSSPAAQQFIAGLAADLPRLVPVLSVVADTVLKVGGALLSGLGPALDALQPALSAAGQFLGVFAQNLGGLLGPLAKGLSALVTGGLAQALTGLVNALGPGLAKVLPVLGQALGQVAAAIGPTLGPLVTFLTDGLVPALPILAHGLSILATTLGGVLNAAMPLAQSLLNALLPAAQALMPSLQELGGALVQLVSALAPVLAQVVDALAPVLTAFAGDLAQLLPPLTTLLTDLVVPLLPPLVSLAQAFAQLLIPLAGLTSVTATGVPMALASRAKLVSGALGMAVQGLAVLLGGLGQAFSIAFNPSAWAAPLAGLGDALRGLFSAIGDGVTNVLQWFIDLPGKIVGLFASAGDWLYNAGGDLLSGLMRGMVDHIPMLGGLLGDITQFVADHKGPPSRDRTLLVPAGRLIMGSLSTGLLAGLPGVQATLAGVTAAVATTPAAGTYTAGAGSASLATVAAATAPAITAAAAGATSAGRTITVKGDYTVNGKTADSAEPGSVEATVHAIVADLINALNADAGAPF